MEIVAQKISKWGQLTAPEIKAIFRNFHDSFTNLAMFLNLIDFGRLSLPTEIKFYKKLLARIYTGCGSVTVHP